MAVIAPHTQRVGEKVHQQEELRLRQRLQDSEIRPGGAGQSRRLRLRRGVRGGRSGEDDRNGDHIAEHSIRPPAIYVMSSYNESRYSTAYRWEATYPVAGHIIRTGARG